MALVYGSAMRDSAENATHDSDGPIACTVKEAARLLSLGTRKVEYMVKSGELESVKIGRSRRIPRKAIDTYLESLRDRAA